MKLGKKILQKLGLLDFARIIHISYDDFLIRKQNTRIRSIWRRLNAHNYTFAANSIDEMTFPVDKVRVGKYSYGPLCVHHFGNKNEKLIVGYYCSISKGVKFILGGNHSINTFSTFPFRFFFNNQEYDASTKGPIIVEDDVWIGTDSIILSGVTLGKGTIVAAGSIVTKSTLPYSVIGGNPAKLIKKRFDDDLIKLLLDIDFSKIDEKKIHGLLPKLHMPLDGKILLEIKSELLSSSQDRT
jgi:virginiamycin A acetyltransferase